MERAIIYLRVLNISIYKILNLKQLSIRFILCTQYTEVHIKVIYTTLYRFMALRGKC